MFFFRKLGKLIFGAATAFQLYAACILGALIGFVPGFEQAPGLLVALVLLTFILNVNLFLVGLCVLLARLLMLVMLPLSFFLGSLILDGPLQGIFATLVNAPFFALCGFEYYVVTGGILPAIVIGILFGAIFSMLLRRLHRKLVNLNRDSAAYKLWMDKTWLKLLSWLLLGGKPDPAKYEKLFGKRIGNPIRVVGLVAAFLLMLALVLIWQLFNGPIFARQLKAGLERVNGATVDLNEAHLDLRQGRMVVDGLAMADAADLQRDLFAASLVEADLSNLDLFRRRLRISKLSISDATSGAQRAEPGVILHAPAPEPPPEDPQIKTIDDYIAEAELWRDRLRQLQRLLEKLSTPEAEDGKTMDETMRERILREGITRVRANHLLQGAPALQIDKIEINGLTIATLGETKFDLVANFLSTQPYLLAETPQLALRARDDSILAQISLASAAMGGKDADNLLSFVYLNLPMDSVQAMLSDSVEQRFSSGTLDIRAEGTWNRASGLLLPMMVDLKNVKTSGIGGRDLLIKSIAVPITLQGPLERPRVILDSGKLGSSLVDAGKDHATEAARGKLEETLEKEGGEAGSLIKGIFGSKKTE